MSYLTPRDVVGSKPNFDENFFNRLGPTDLFVSVRFVSLSIGRKFSRWRQINLENNHLLNFKMLEKFNEIQ